MCGITGIVSIAPNSNHYFEKIGTATSKLKSRGPDYSGQLIEYPVALGHARLSIIDVNPRSNQPMTNADGRFTIVFNGEIYNYKALRQECESAGFVFSTESDTEVLLNLYILHGTDCLAKLNGFFAFSIYDRTEQKLFLARDRMGIKPLVYYASDNTFAFGSELKAIYAFDLPRILDKVSVFTYFKLNYIPAPSTILKDYYKLEPGHSLTVKWNANRVEVDKTQWYETLYNEEEAKRLTAHDYKQSQKVLKRFVRESVRRRLVADVGIGTFLSGGIDSSIISTIAKEEKEDIEAFTISFPTHKYFDESESAKAVAKKANIKHHIIPVNNEDLEQSAEDILGHLDEPFGDSSIVNMNILSREVKKHVTVALSGDGGDELFAGYHKHGAEFRIRYPALREHIVGKMNPFWGVLPSSRSGHIPNFIRQLHKFSEGYNLNHADRYWRWAGIMNEEQTNYLIKEEMLEREQRLSDNGYEYKKRKDYLLKAVSKKGGLNEALLADVKMVLPNDMLFKVDHASMMHGLEVRTPLLDHSIVQYAFKLPVMFKINQLGKKKILRDAFADKLPRSVFDNPKRGFEVPLLDWFKGNLKNRLNEEVNDLDFIQHQNIFNPTALTEIHDKLYSRNPGDAASWAWAFLVFQSWYKRNIL